MAEQKIDPATQIDEIKHSILNDDEAGKHRLIDDGVSTPTGLWSSEKIAAEVANGNGHTHAHADTTGQGPNDHHNQVHAIGGGDHSGTMTLAELNAFISDATLVDKDAPNTWTRKQTFTPSVAEEAIEATGGTDKAGIKTTGGGTTGDGLQAYGAGETVSQEALENTVGVGAVSIGGVFGLWSEGATEDGAAIVGSAYDSAIGGILLGGPAAAGSNNQGGSAAEIEGGVGDGSGDGGEGILVDAGNGGATGSGGRAASFFAGSAGSAGNGEGGRGANFTGGTGYGSGNGGEAAVLVGGTANGSGADGLGLNATPDVKIKLYSQASEPTLLETEAAAFWKNTGDSNRMYLIFRRGVADQVKVEMT